MANYTTSADLVNDILFRASEPTDGTSDFDAAALQYLNRAYQGIWSGGSELDPEIMEVWWWLRKDDQGVLTLDPVTDTGTVSVTNNNATITFSSAPAATQAGRHFKVDDHADVFIISSHTAASDTATLESVYTGPTDTTANFKAFKVDYDLASDLLYLTSPFIAFQDSRDEIPVIDLDKLREKWPLNSIGSGVPKNAAFIGERKVRFSHYGGVSSTELIKLDYEYIYEPSDLADDSNAPLVPRQYRKILSDWGTAWLLMDKEDDKAIAALKAATSGVQAMARENRKRMLMASGSENFGKIKPRQGEVANFKGPLRTESGLIIGPQ
jgi:hypothetical protein|tara:strand:+ start:4910 stop:5884 length:975 start_codon:yes stop_codon:yes gene_type:complete